MATPKDHPAIRKAVYDDTEEKAETRKALKLESLRIEVADNGYVLVEELRPAQRAKSNAPSTYEPPDRKVFETADSLLTYLAGELKARAAKS